MITGMAYEAYLTMPTAQLDPTGENPALPSAPRPLSKLIRRRAWSERHVRVWWLLGAALLIITCYYAISRIYLWTEETKLITHGEKVMGEVTGWSGGVAAKNQHAVLSPNTVVDIEYSYKGTVYHDRSELIGRTEQIFTHTPFPLFIDPKNPLHWTARIVPAPLASELLPALMLAPFVVLLFVVAFLRRQRVLRIYREGQAIQAEVMNVGHSAAAPFSRLLSCAAHLDANEDRVIKILLPTRKAPDVGETLWLIALPKSPDHAIPLALFE
jgi:hypothetical protein